jgi:23S rRNA (cytidine1920-2'-O)/16S rRNA (cytidine1409-2'-O)-methyltransferase
MKERLDVLLVKRQLLPTRKQAREFIEAGKVRGADGRIFTKAGTMVDSAADLSLTQEPEGYVGRGAKKLQEAFLRFGLNVEHQVCLDIGASTGGFTQCMLQHGAGKVYAVDVGHGQLAASLLEDSRVVNMEGTNVRYLDAAALGEKADFASIDVSFISLTKVLEPVCALLKEDGRICCLVKPQFEAGKNRVGKGGIVKDLKVHQEILEGILAFACTIGLSPQALAFSPITGQEGNTEYLLYLKKPECTSSGSIPMGGDR